MEYFLKYLFHSILYDLAVDDLFAAYRRRTTPPLFQGGKSEFLLGRDAAPSPHVTFEIKVIVYAAYRRRLTPPLFNGEKAARKRLLSLRRR